MEIKKEMEKIQVCGFCSSDETRDFEAAEEMNSGQADVDGENWGNLVDNADANILLEKLEKTHLHNSPADTNRDFLKPPEEKSSAQDNIDEDWEALADRPLQKIVMEKKIFAQDNADGECETLANRSVPKILLNEKSSAQDDVDEDWEFLVDKPLLKIAAEEKSSAQDEVNEDWETCENQPLQKIAEKSTTKRRGRGHFLYNRDSLYSDQIDKNEFELESDSRGGRAESSGLSNSGFRHVLVLEDLSMSTRTTDIEKIFVGFKEDGVAVRWVNDTCALVLFRNPTTASQALRLTPCPFKIRIMEDDDDKILSLVSARDLEPPQPRPKTSARVAQRMIAQGMGLKLQTSFGSKELREQEAERRNRIQARHGLRDDAWGPDEL